MIQKDLYVNAPATLFIIVQNYNKFVSTSELAKYDAYGYSKVILN